MDGDGREEVVREYLYGARGEEGRTWLVLVLYFRLPLAGLVSSVNAREGARSHMSFLRNLVSGAQERTCKPTHERFLFVESYGIDVGEGWRWCEGGIYTSFWA
jgi:hypothetical protein